MYTIHKTDDFTACTYIHGYIVRMSAMASGIEMIAAGLGPAATEGAKTGWLSRFREGLSRTVRRVIASLDRPG